MCDRLAWKDRWSNIDRTDDPEQFVRALDAVWGGDAGDSAYPVSGFLKVREGESILDVGCGLGGAVRALARDVGETGRVFGVDNSATMVAEARRRSARLKLPVEFGVADAHHLPFADGSFDGCYIIDVIDLVRDPRRVLSEMVRVVRSGGRIVVNATDFGSWIFDAADQNLTCRIMNFVCDHETNGTIARQLRRRFVEMGLADVKMVLRVGGYTDLAPIRDIWLRGWIDDAIAVGLVSMEEADAWLGDLEERDSQGLFLLGAITFVVYGKKP